MKTMIQSFAGSLAVLLLLPKLGWTAEPSVIFGLRHTPVGGAVISTNDGNLRVTPSGEEVIATGELGAGEFGVSIDLGQADSGLFGYLDTYSSFQNDANFMVGRVYGRLNGLADQFICSLRATTIGWGGSYEVEANFSPLGSASLCYEVFNGTRRVALVSGTSRSFFIDTYSEFGPWANPFCRLPDGGVAAIIQLSALRSIQLPVSGDAAWVEGDRILIRPENASAVVDFASRLDVTAGGGEDEIVITQERLGMFNHGHRALGNSILEATNGVLTVARLDEEALGNDMGVSVGLDDSRRFALRLQAQELATNAALVASAIGSHQGQGGEFLGYAGIRSGGGAVQAFGSFPGSPAGLHVSVYRNECPVGTVFAVNPDAQVNLSGNPQAAGFDAAADSGTTPPWLAVRLDRLTTFSLPDGSTLEGDQVRFRSASSVPLDRLSAFSLTTSNLTSFTIIGESGPQTIELADYLADITAPALLKRFSGADEGESYYVRSSVRTNLDGHPAVAMTDRWSETNSVSATFSFEEDGLHFYGYSHLPLELGSASGIRVVPEEVLLGRNYFSMASFQWAFPDSGQEIPVAGTCVTKVVGFEIVNVPAGSFSALRLETVITFATDTPENYAGCLYATNWLARDVGAVKFSERERLWDGTERSRSGELSDYAIRTTPTQAPVANVGANVLLRADVLASPAAQYELWLKGGTEVVAGFDPRLVLANVQYSDAGTYSVVLRLSPDCALTNDVACLTVVPFSDTPPFWVAAFDADWWLDARATAVDGVGNVYVAGRFNSLLMVGTNRLVSRGQEDVFLVKFDSAGQVAWVRSAGGTQYDSVSGLAVDGADNVYLMGGISGPASFGSIQLIPTGRNSVYVTKVDPAGTFLWATKTDVTDYQYANGLAVDSAGNQYILGAFNDGILNLGSISLTNSSAAYGYNLFLAQLDPSGQFLWARQVEGEESLYPNALALDESGGLYLAGSFWRMADFDGIQLNSGGPYQNAGFVAKADLSGSFRWAQTLGTAASSLALNSAHSLIVAGQFTGTFSLGATLLTAPDADATCVYLAKLAPDGTALWAKVPEQASGYYDRPLAVDSADNLYLAGSFHDEGTFGGTTFCGDSYYESTVISKLTPAGEPLWHKHLSDWGSGGQNSPAALARDSQGNVYLTGEFRNRVVCGETNLVSSADDSVFVVKITGATAPTLTAQPQSQTANLGESVTFSVTAAGTAPLLYQWRKDGANIEGATGSSYAIAEARSADGGAYSVVVKNAGGFATSDNAILQVLAPEAGTVAFGSTEFTLTETNAVALWTVLRTGPTSSVATVDFVTAAGTATPGLDYWATAVTLRFEPGETSKTVNVPITDDTEPEADETVILRLCNPGPGVVVGQLDTATLTITDNDPPGMPFITLNPVPRTVFTGGQVTFSVGAQGAAPLAYQWLKNGMAIPDATNSIYTLDDVQLTDAAAYSVVVSNAVGETTSSDAVLTVIPLPDLSFVMFGLKHRPLPNTVVNLNGNIVLTPGDGGDGGSVTTPTSSILPAPATGVPGTGDGNFGASIELGQADSGLFVYLDTQSAFQVDGCFTIGRAFGQLNGQTNQLLCSLGAETTDIFMGYFDIFADFSPLGASTVTYEVYEGRRLVATVTGASEAVSLTSYGESSPMGNPFWRLADGSVAAIVQLSYSQGFYLPDPRGWADIWADGDRLVIRPENPVSVADFVSRVEVSAGNEEDRIIITQERLGMFRHSHLILGDARFHATNGTLTVTRLNPEEDLGGEIGTSVALEEPRRFSLKLAPQALGDEGAALVASAVAGSPNGNGEFLGFVGARNAGDTVQLFGSFSAFAGSLHLSVYRNDCEVGTVPAFTPGVAVNVTGQPQVIGFDAAASSGLIPPWLGVRLDRPTTFTLPDGSTLEGDQLRFRATGSTPLDRLTAFSLTCSNLPAFTITGESGDRPTMSVAELLPEITAAASLKRFVGWDDSASVEFIRTSAWTHADGPKQVMLTDRWGQNNAVSAVWSLQEDGLRFHGSARGPLELSGTAGLRLLPDEIALGQTYFSAGQFQWHEATTGQDYPVDVSCVATIAAMDTFYSPTGAYTALRLETVTTFTGAAPTNAPTTQICTNWLVAGVGVVKFDDSEAFADGAVRTRSGVLTDFAIVKPPPQRHFVNVGANVIFRLDWIASPSAFVAEWRKDGESLFPSEQDSYVLQPVAEGDGGIYSVDIRLRNRGEAIALRADIADVRVLPFSDTPPFWAAGFGANSTLQVMGTVADANGDVYVAGYFRGMLQAGGTSLVSSNGSDDAFLLKLSPSGAPAWVRQVGGQGTDYAAGVGVDAAGNAYLAGTFGVAAQAGAIRIVDPCSSQGVFMAKLDPNGNFLWATNAGGGTPSANGVAVDSAGNQYVLGTFWSGLTCGGTSLPGDSGAASTFLTKLDASGQFLWAKRIFGLQSAVFAGSVVLDGLGGLYVTGTFDSYACFDAIILHAGSSRAGFLARADVDGNFLWARALGSAARSAASDRAANVYVTGEYSGTASFGSVFLSVNGSEGYGTYLVKMTAGGDVVWARSAEHMIGYGLNPLQVDSRDSVYLAGAFYCERTYGATTYQSGGGYGSTILTKLDGAGQILWRKHITGPANNSPAALARDDAGNVYLSGQYRSGVLFGDTRLDTKGTESAYVVQITGATAPTVTQQPLSQTVNEGEPVTFTVAATGTEPIFYQWRKDGVDLPGATGTQFAIPHARRSDRGTYTVVVKNAGGLVTSVGATLQVLVPDAGTVAFGATDYLVEETNGLLLVVVERTGNTSAAAVVDVVTSDGTALVGQDYWGMAVSLRFASGETSKTVTLPILDDPEPESAETLFLRLCHPGSGVVVGQPDTATVTITDNDPAGIPVIRRQPASALVAVGGTVTFSVVAHGAPPLSYQWRKNGVDIPSATDRYYTIGDVQPADAGVYDVVVRNAVGQTTSAEATLTVVSPPVILVQPQSQTVPYYEAATFSVVATSSLPVVTQVFTRVSTGPGDDWYNFPASWGGNLSIAYDFCASPDTLEVYALDDGMTWRLLGRLTTNGTGVFTLNYDAPWTGQLAIRVAPVAADDGWSYRVEQVTSLLTYRWRCNGYDAGATGSSYTIDPVLLYYDGQQYSVVVSDPGGSVVSESARLTVSGPLLRIVPVTCPGNTNGTCVQLFWRAPDYHLEMIEDHETDQWHDVPGAYSGMTIQVIESQTFFRLSRTQRPD